MPEIQGLSLKSRAIAFAFAVGAVAFTLALLAGARFDGSVEDTTRALIAALICGVMCWASAERAISGTAEAVDAVTARIAAAAAGDLVSPPPPCIERELPDLAGTLDDLFRQMRTTIASVSDLAMNDPVTELPNRRHFRREAERMIDEFGESDRAALIFIDLDRFKTVNDSLGHAVGDRLLEMVAERLRNVTGLEAGAALPDDGPLLARLAGDEFTLLLPAVADSAVAEAAAQAILEALSKPLALSGHTIDIGASLGVALYPEHGRRLGALMRAADVAMYHAKAQGGRQVQLFTGMLASRQEDRVRHERELRAAIERKEFALAFQPQVDLVSGQPVAVEALLRWHHPEGMRLPDSLLSIAENSGLIFGIGEWYIEEAAATVARWHAAGLDQRLIVKTSRRQLESQDFFVNLRDALARHAAPAHLLEIEISERAATGFPATMLDSMAALRADGVVLTLADFGTGSSSVMGLKDMPIDRAKLDRGLIRDIAQSDKVRAIVQSLIGLVHGLEYEAVAEGVDTAEQADLLRAIGCDAAQGMALGPTMSDEDYRVWLPEVVSIRPERVSRARGG